MAVAERWNTPLFKLDTLLLFVFGALDLKEIDNLPLPIFATMAAAFWPLLLVCCIADLHPRAGAWAEHLKLWAVVGVIGVLALGGTMSYIALRQTVDRNRYVHDNAVLIEEGITQVLAGRNFYPVDYRTTALAAHQGGTFYDATAGEYFENPALDHYITPPFYTLASVPFAVASRWLLGWYDQRFVHLLAYAVIGLVAYHLPRAPWLKTVALVGLTLNPMQFQALVVGMSDTFVLAFLMLSIWWFARRRPTLAAAALGLAAASKQTAWLVAPFLVAYWYARARQAGESAVGALRRCVRQLWVGPAVFGAFVLPYLWWDPAAFLDDIYRYPAGLLPTSFPIFGYGLSVLLQFFGFPPSPRAYFPYGWLQAAVAGPIFLVAMRWLLRQPSLARSVASGGVFLLAFWWLNRFFNENYFSVLAALFAVAAVLAVEEQLAPTARSPA